MRVKILSELKTIMSNPNSAHNCFAWPTVTKLPDGKLAAVASGFRVGHLCPFGKCVISYSDDEGKSWTKPAPVIDTPLDDRDGGICVSKNGVVIVTSFNNSIKAQRQFSADCKKASEHTNNVARPAEFVNYIDSYLDYLSITDAEEKYLGSNFVISKDGGETFGKIHTIPITAPHGPVPYKDGFLYVGSRFLPDAMPVYGIVNLSCYFIDEDGNITFMSEIDKIDDTIYSCEPHAIVLSDDKILVHIRAERYDPEGPEGHSNVFTIYQSISEDGGKSFSKPEPIFEDSCSGAPSHIIRHSSGVLVCTYGYRKPTYGIKAAISADEGQNWMEVGYIYDKCATSDIGYPSSVEIDDGSILTVFYSRDEKTAPQEIKSIIWEFEK